MLKRITLITIYLSTTILYCLVAKPEPVHACAYPEFENWWYWQDYEFPKQHLPEGITIEMHHDYSVVGEIFFANSHNENLYLIPADHYDKEPFQNLSEESLIDQTSLDNYGDQITIKVDYQGPRWENWFRAWEIIPETRWQNSDFPGASINEVPDPQQLELWLVDDGIFHSIPFTVTYSINPDYDPNKVVPSASLEERIIASTAIIEGVATRAENEITDRFGKDLVFGTATFSVSSWLKGEGPATIKVDSFGHGADCLPILNPDDPVILFLGKPIGQDHYTLLTVTEEQLAPVSESATISSIVGHPPLIITPEATPTATPAEEPTPTVPTEEEQPTIPIERGKSEDNGRFGNRETTMIFMGGGIALLGLIVILIRGDFRKM